MCLALDLSLQQVDYYRPATAQAIRESSLALGDWAALFPIDAISTQMSGREIHSWCLERLHRNPAQLVSDLSTFMTLRAGDVLLIGLPGDAPILSEECELTVMAPGLPTLKTRLVEEQA
jgi:5-oxopent-3-ene-1,2,5-tricarboxylate decarboxylase/2-hydroxyhepta-2,4-diene-1,7-dioate isomerase